MQKSKEAMEEETTPTDKLAVPAVFDSLLVPNSMFELDMRNSKNVLKAYLEAQKNVGKVVKNKKNAAFGGASKYADLASVLEAIDTAAQDAGLVILQPYRYEAGPDGKPCLMLYTCIAHADSGEALVSYAPIAVASLADAQKVGSYMTYLRRYTLLAMFGLAPEDDDGNAASGKVAPSPKNNGAVLSPHKENLKQVLKAKGAADKATVTKLLKSVGVDKTFQDITEAEAPAIINKLESVGGF